MVHPRNRTTYALLGFLTWGPMSGYDLKQAIAGSVGNFWTEGYGQIYPMLRRLVELGWATREATKGSGKRARYLYEITDAGRRALHEWLQAPVLETPPRIELLLKLFFGPEVPLSVSLAHIEAARARASADLVHYRTIAGNLEKRHPTDPRLAFWLLTTDYGLKATRARIEWCDHACRELSRLAGSDKTLTPDAGTDNPVHPQPEKERV